MLFRHSRESGQPEIVGVAALAVKNTYY